MRSSGKAIEAAMIKEVIVEVRIYLFPRAKA